MSDLTITSPYVHSRVNSNTFIRGTLWRVGLCQSRLYPPQSGTLSLASGINTIKTLKVTFYWYFEVLEERFDDNTTFFTLLIQGSSAVSFFYIKCINTVHDLFDMHVLYIAAFYFANIFSALRTIWLRFLQLFLPQFVHCWLFSALFYTQCSDTLRTFIADLYEQYHLANV
jgi:hypothetical protein